MMKVQRILTGPMGLRVTLGQNRFTVQFTDMSTAVHLTLHDWGKDDEGEPRTLVIITALLLWEVKVTPALFEWVARSGGSRLFGHVELVDCDDPGKVNLWMTHTLLGDYLDEKELETAMYAVLYTADAWDDELQQRFGGKRWAET